MKHKILLLILLIYTVLVYKDSLNYSFISDDYFNISFNSITETFRFHQGFPHYIPVFFILLLFVKRFFGLNPIAFHAIAVMFHLINTVLIYRLSRMLFNSTKKGLVSALFFSTLWFHYEVVYWITGISTSLMVFFYMFSVLAFLHFMKSRKIMYCIWFSVFFFLSYLSHEYAISLALLPILYCSMVRKSGYLIRKYSMLILGPILFITALTLMKIIYTSNALVIGIPSAKRFITSIVQSLAYIIIPNPNFGMVPKPIFVLSTLIVVFVIFRKSIEKGLRLFFFSWFILTILVYAATSLPQARYFYLSAIPAILLITSFFQSRNNLVSAKGVLLTVYCFFTIISGFIYLRYQHGFWVLSSTIADQTISVIKSSLPLGYNGKIYAVNFPESINGPPWKAYIWGNGLQEALNLYDININSVTFLRTVPYDQHLRDAQVVNINTSEQLRRGGKQVFIYDLSTKKINSL